MTKFGALSFAILAGVIPALDPVVSALTREAVPGVTLELSWAYLALAPFLGVLDYLTVLTVPQHVTVLVSTLLAFGAWRVVRKRGPRGVPLRILIETGALAGFLVALGAFYGFGVLGPRPMAKLVVDDPDIVVVDFHSHTNASHDGRWDFDTERNRRWHRGTGFHVAYVTDHDSIAPAYRALDRNPVRAGDDTVLLPGREVVYAGQHVVVLGGVDPRAGVGEWLPATEAPPAPHSVGGHEGQTRWCVGWPVLIQTIPNDLGRVPVPACSPAGGGVEAIQIVDGDPRGLAQSAREFDRILAIADSLDIVLVSASNLHGWGSTAASWNLMRIGGWRDMTPEAVGAVIEDMIRHGGRDAVEVVVYRRPSIATDRGVATLGASVSLPAQFIGSRSRAERLVWLLWIGAALGAGRLIDRRRRASRLLG